MLFSRYRLKQLAKVNSSSLYALLAKQKNLESLKLKKKVISDNIRNVIKSKSDLPDNSGLFKSSLDIDVLKSLGYKDLDDLINRLNKNNDETRVELEEVNQIKQKVKDTLELLDDVDVSKDMEDQVVNEVILDSQLTEIREKSHEILLMLSTETDSSFLSKSQDLIKTNEAKIAKYLKDVKTSKLDTQKVYNGKVENFNTVVNSMNSDMKQAIDNQDSLFSTIDHNLSNLSATKKNIILGTAFLGSLLLGLKGKSSKGKKNEG